MRNGRCENRLCARAPRARQGSRFGSKVFLVDCLLRRTLNMAKISITKRARAFHSKCNHSKNITATRYRTDVIWSVLLLHIRASLSMMLARDYPSCHATKSTLVILVANNVHTLRWHVTHVNPIDHLLYLKRKVRAQSLQLNLRELTCVIHQMCAAIPQQYIHRHILSMSTRYIVVNATPSGCIKYWNEIKYDVIWFCCFCFKGVHVNPLT